MRPLLPTLAEELHGWQVIPLIYAIYKPFYGQSNLLEISLHYEFPFRNWTPHWHYLVNNLWKSIQLQHGTAWIVIGQ